MGYTKNKEGCSILRRPAIGPCPTGRGVLVGTQDLFRSEIARTQTVNTIKNPRHVAGGYRGEPVLYRVPLNNQ